MASSKSRLSQLCAPVAGAHHAARIARQHRVLVIISWIAALVAGGFGVLQLLTTDDPRIVAVCVLNLVSAAAFLAVPLLHRFGELAAPLAFIVLAYGSLTFITVTVGTGGGLLLYFPVAAAIVVVVLGIERIALAVLLAAIGVVTAVVLRLTVPYNTGVQPDWTLTAAFLTSVVTASVMAFAAVWYALREAARAEHALGLEYDRSERLLANILPASVADRLKDPEHDMIADRYDDASILFADIAGYTERAGQIPPSDLVAFLDRLYTEFDRLADAHGLEKIKTTGDSYMVVSGVPEPRPDHLEALAAFALDMARVVGTLRDPTGAPVPLRIGLAAGPVVAGVVGARRFFYDVWGDAVNVASRMESTDQEGRIQVPESVRHRLADTFAFEERGEVAIKGKGVMRTWYLLGPRSGDPEDVPATGSGASGGGWPS